MSKFEKLTRYLPALEDDAIGTWVIDRENDGSSEHPIQLPFVDYSDTVNNFVRDVYDFNTQYPELGLNRYGEILEQRGIAWNSKAMSEADVSALDAQSIMALIMGAVRADRFCEGALMAFFKDGSIKKWLERLKELD